MFSDRRRSAQAVRSKRKGGTTSIRRVTRPIDNDSILRERYSNDEPVMSVRLSALDQPYRHSAYDSSNRTVERFDADHEAQFQSSGRARIRQGAWSFKHFDPTSAERSAFVGTATAQSFRRSSVSQLPVSGHDSVSKKALSSSVSTSCGTQ